MAVETSRAPRFLTLEEYAVPPRPGRRHDLGAGRWDAGAGEPSAEGAPRSGHEALRAARAEIATANGKTAAGLVDALVAAAKADLDEKVESGRLTEAQRTSILADLESRMEDVVAGEFSFGFRGHRGGPPPGLDPSVAPESTDA